MVHGWRGRVQPPPEQVGEARRQSPTPEARVERKRSVERGGGGGEERRGSRGVQSGEYDPIQEKLC